MNDIKLGSLFDGSAGFPLAGTMYGMTAVWASEIEPYPIRVTTKRLPYMKHYGDISKMNGAEIEPVDIITGGSPCQDMSVAGKRAGLDGERSCLFREQIRIIKEMREATNGQYPRFMLWENVPGAISSNKGDDFRCVLEETARIKDPEFNVPMPKNNKWSTAGLIMGDGFSIGWRVLDAQYWGVPQRRRRIFLVADFGGESAGEILFKREGLSWHFTQSREAWQGTAGSLAAGIDPTGEHPVFSIDREAMNSGYEFDRAPGIDESETAYTLKATGPGGVAHPAILEMPVVIDRAFYNQGANAQYDPQLYEDGTCPTLIARGPSAVSYQDKTGTLMANSHPGSYRGQDAFSDMFVANDYIVRRLTPLECARLQGFPDWWTADLGTKDEDITDEDMNFWREVFETHRKIVTGASKPKTDKQIRKWLIDPDSDSAEYKMWGNGVALPCVLYVMEGIAMEMSKGGVAGGSTEQ